MYLIHKRDHIRNARHRWLAQYAQYPDTQIAMWARPRTIGDIRSALAALDMDNCSERDVDEAIGTSGWASLNCDECKESVETLVHFGDEPDYEVRWQDLCDECLTKGLDMLKTVNTPKAPE